MEGNSTLDFASFKARVMRDPDPGIRFRNEDPHFVHLFCWKLPMQLRVSDLMRSCASAIVTESTLLREAAEILLSADCPVLIAQQPTGELLGVIAEAAIIRQLITDGNQDANVSSVISRHVESVRMTSRLDAILHLFRSSCNSVVPVVDNDNSVVGMLHRQDVVRLLLDDGPQESRHSTTDRPHFLRREKYQKRVQNERPSEDGPAAP